MTWANERPAVATDGVLKAAIGQVGTVQDPEPGWDEEMVFVQLDSGLDGLWWPEDLEPLAGESRG